MKAIKRASNTLAVHQKEEVESLPKKPRFEESPKRALIVTSDFQCQRSISSALHKSIPYIKTLVVKNGLEAWQELQRQPYDLIVTDWDLEGVSGLALVNRMRMDEYYKHVPVTILSDLISDEDHCFIEEYSYTGLLSKPVRSLGLISQVQAHFSEAKWFVNQETLVREVMDRLGNTSSSVEDEKLQEFISGCPKAVPALLVVIRYLRSQGQLDKALKLALRAGELDPESLAIESELGKIYLSRGELENARFYLKKALDKSPSNIDRLCDLAKAHVVAAEAEQAKKYFQSALDIDEHCDIAQSGYKLSLRIEQFYSQNNPQHIPQSLASLLNAIGIGLVRGGDLDSGIEHYQTALTYIQDDQKKAYVCFNLGLGFLKHCKYRDAVEWLNKSLEFKPDYMKSVIYLDKARKKIVSKGEAIGELKDYEILGAEIETK